MVHRVIISGGGTGGHIFPAIAIANALRRLDPQIEILFVGAEDRMEMERVPAAGYDIVGLKIQGIARGSLLRNLQAPFKLFSSLRQSKRIIKKFGADAAVGVGGFASGPLVWVAQRMGLPTLVQEQNSYAGVTNKLLGRKAEKICVAYEGMEQFFPADKLLLTGNPVRRASVDIEGKRKEALDFFGLQESKKTIFVTSGSLGAKTINAFILEAMDEIEKNYDLQIIWQTGQTYYDDMYRLLRVDAMLPWRVKVMPFVERMDYAYAAADLIISRAGAGTISELCIVGKPVILVPSPNVAEDHQTKNAEALVSKGAAVLVEDEVARDTLYEESLKLFADEAKMAEMSTAIKKMAMLEADEEIAKEVLKLMKLKKGDES